MRKPDATNTFSDMTVKELREQLKSHGVTGISALNKAELIDRLQNITAPIVRASEDTSTPETIKAQTTPIRSGEKQLPGHERRSTDSQRTSNSFSRPTSGSEKHTTPHPHRKETTDAPPQRGKKQSTTPQHTPEKIPQKQPALPAKASETATRPNAAPTPIQEAEKKPVSQESVQETTPAAVSAPGEPSDRQQLRSRVSSDISPDPVTGILEILQEGFGFLRMENYLPGNKDVYVAATQIRRFRLQNGDKVTGTIREAQFPGRYASLAFITAINGGAPEPIYASHFESLIPVFPDERLHLETAGGSTAMRMVDLFAPIGKGQRGLIVAPPKTGKTTLLKQLARSVIVNHPETQLIILLIDERPEEVTDMREHVADSNAEVVYSTFDELPEHHIRVAEAVLTRARRLVECGKDVVVLLDSITRMTRAYNLTVTSSGRTLSGGLDPAALHFPKKFFGAARNIRGGGSLTILATALVETGSRMDDVIYEEFKGTGNMEIVLDRRLAEKRIYPALDLPKSGTRRDDLLLTSEEQRAMNVIRKSGSTIRQDDFTERILSLITGTKENAHMISVLQRAGKIPTPLALQKMEE